MTFFLCLCLLLPPPSLSRNLTPPHHFSRSFSAESDVIFLYVKAKLGWSFTRYATFFALKCGVDGVALLLLLPLLRRCLGLRDASLGVLGGLSRAAYFIVLGSAYKPSMVFGGKLE